MNVEKTFRDEILIQLKKHSPIGEEAGRFLRKKNVKLKFRKQTHSAAAWTLTGNIHLNLEFKQVGLSLEDPYLLSLIVHETRHLQQGLINALSVYGELDAWQVGFNFLHDMSGSPLPPILDEIIATPLNWSRCGLANAAYLMKKYSPLYRIDLLPLYPLPLEIAWWLTRKEPV